MSRSIQPYLSVAQAKALLAISDEGFAAIEAGATLGLKSNQITAAYTARNRLQRAVRAAEAPVKL